MKLQVDRPGGWGRLLGRITARLLDRWPHVPIKMHGARLQQRFLDGGRRACPDLYFYKSPKIYGQYPTFSIVAGKETRTYLINALGSPKSLKKRPFRSGPTIYEMASNKQRLCEIVNRNLCY